MSHKHRVFGIPIDGVSEADVLAEVGREDRTEPLWIVTANPEILLAGLRDPSYAKTLQQADLRLVDGFGLWFLMRLFGWKTHRVTGADLAEKIVALAEQKEWRVALIGGTPGISQAAAKFLKEKYQKCSSLAEEGGFVKPDGTDNAAGEEARHRLTLFDPQVLLVALGHPKQERWIANYLGDFPRLKIVMGVGGTFDFWAGKIKRAPQWMRSIGLEWLWRLICEPKRIERIWHAVVMFPILFVWERLGGFFLKNGDDGGA